MSKEDILADLNRKKTQLSQAKERLKVLTEQYEVIDDFLQRVTGRIDSFNEMMQRRKGKISKISPILCRVKSAKRYYEKMNDMLIGNENRAAVLSISNMESSVATKKRETRNAITDTEGQIEKLKYEVEQLQYLYNTYPEEVQANA